MKELDNLKVEYINILNRLQKKYFVIEGFLITFKYYFTNNIFYYYVCMIYRFIPLILLSGNYFETFNENDNFFSFYYYLNLFTIHHYVKFGNISYNLYLQINIFIYVFSLITIITYLLTLKEFHDYQYTNKIIIPSKYRIINDHLIFLFFPCIIEYLSCSFYIFFFPNNYPIKFNSRNIILYIIIIINGILIIFYNIINYICIICSNKIYTTSLIESYLKIENNNLMNNKPISFRFSKLDIYISIYLQNFVLILSFEKYLNNYHKTIFKIIISIVLILVIIILFFCKMYEYHYTNTINTLYNVFLLFCFYSIIFDFILFLFKNEINNRMFEIIYIIMKIFTSYVTYLLYNIKMHKYFESKIIEILFQEKKNEKETIFLNSFYYLHEIMVKIKENKDIRSVLLMVNIIYKHIIKCNKENCNCKLLCNIVKKANFDKKNNEIIKSYIPDLLIILNYLFECIFIEYDYYYNNYELTLLLAEHFCNLKHNPIMSFSFIHTLIIKHIKKFSSYQMLILHESCQKYIYYISANAKKEIESNNNENLNEIMLNKIREEFFEMYYKNSKISNNIKYNIIDYINNHIKILKFKNIFEDSLKFIFDDSNEFITSVKINFFNNNSNIDDFNQNNKKNRNKKIEKRNNLYKIIYLLKKEQFYYNYIIKYINRMDNMKNTKIYTVFKCILFFDIFNGGQIPNEISGIILKEKMNLYTNYITENEYSLLKKLYDEQNNNFNSKYFSIFEYNKDLKTKYFCEYCALKLGFKQKDIINEKMEVLFPKKFYESHQNMVKYLIIGNQLKHFNDLEGYLFDSSTTVLYTVTVESSLIYNISKNLVIISVFLFKLQNQYKFMLNNNFELLANSKNFEDEYFFNKKIIEAYYIKIMDILEIKQEKLYKIFEKTFKKIDNQRLLRKIKTEEYFIPQFYVQAGEKNTGMMNSNHFNISKKNFISKISNFKIENENTEDENKNFINKEKNNQIIINDLFINQEEIIILH